MPGVTDDGNKSSVKSLKAEIVRSIFQGSKGRTVKFPMLLNQSRVGGVNDLGEEKSQWLCTRGCETAAFRLRRHSISALGNPISGNITGTLTKFSLTPILSTPTFAPQSTAQHTSTVGLPSRASVTPISYRLTPHTHCQ